MPKKISQLDKAAVPERILEANIRRTLERPTLAEMCERLSRRSVSLALSAADAVRAERDAR
jgi:hypothetical protein